MGYPTIFKSSITQHHLRPLLPHFFGLHELAYGKTRFAIQNVTIVLQSENKTYKEFIYFKYKCIYHPRVQCSLERCLIMPFSKLVPNFLITNPSIPIQALLPCTIKVVLHIKEATKTAQNTYFSCLCSNLIINVIFLNFTSLSNASYYIIS